MTELIAVFIAVFLVVGRELVLDYKAGKKSERVLQLLKASVGKG